MKPSNSTYASLALGVPLATIISWAVNAFTGVTVPGPVEAALGAVLGALVGYVFKGGRAEDTEEAPAPPPQTVARTPGWAVVVALLLTVFMIFGCSTFKEVSEKDGAQDVMTIATLFAIERSADRNARALAIIKAAEEFKTFADFQGVTVDQLVVKVRERIAKSDAELSEKAGLTLLLNRAKALIDESIDTGELDPTEKATVNKLLDWVIDAAQAYAGPRGSAETRTAPTATTA